MSEASLVALLGLCGTAVTVLGVVLVALINSRKEMSAATTREVEDTLRERIIFKDEKIADLTAEVARLRLRIDKIDEGV